MNGVRIPASDETAWIRQAQQGSAAAFTSLVEAWQSPLYNFCYRMLGEPEAAEDAAQETFLKAYQNLARYDKQRPFGTWLLAIAAHHCIDQLRRRHLLPISMDAFDDQGARLPDRNASDPETETFRRLEREQIQRLLQSLDPIQRSILVLHYWQQASEAEIGLALHISPLAVKARLHRAKRTLARLWEMQPAYPHMGRIAGENLPIQA